MRTAVVRIDVDPARGLSAARLADGLAALREAAATEAAEVHDAGLAERVAQAGAAAGKREIQLLVGTDDPETALRVLTELCALAFGTEPAAGAVTFISRGTDDDAHGVLAGFGLAGDITRSVDADGFDVVVVTVREADLERVPESRIHTALEASLNCEVQILTR
ncbi:hypothetical protein [Nocardia bovistercoris]|uniref:Uncharacterized protein n=1 Tax=Nocardia bovistercoris TaxID=2785916 RepID=A0A931IIT8_9NOCA|nr:hypothetical protein [Nocardia bovistercoris]MBH0781111.1 hypothetical protein [Nocardia bovistercoris]